MNTKLFHISIQTFLVTITTVFYVNSEAGKLVIVSDDPAAAQAVVDMMSKTEPYASMLNAQSLTITTKTIDSQTLNTSCTFNVLSQGTLQCPDVVSRTAADLNADKVFVIKKDTRQAASADMNGIGAAMTSVMPPEVAIHEIAHLAGLADEYTFSATDAATYCTTTWRAPNLTFLEEVPPYTSDLRARNMHGAYIPWYGQMTARLITTGTNLGTPEPNRIGLYRSQVCTNAPKNTKGNLIVSSWRPGDDNTPTIMSVPESGYIPESFYPLIYAAFNIPMPESADTSADEAGSATINQ